MITEMKAGASIDAENTTYIHIATGPTDENGSVPAICGIHIESPDLVTDEFFADRRPLTVEATKGYCPWCINGFKLNTAEKSGHMVQTPEVEKIAYTLDQAATAIALFLSSLDPDEAGAALGASMYWALENGHEEDDPPNYETTKLVIAEITLTAMGRLKEVSTADEQAIIKSAMRDRITHLEKIYGALPRPQ